MTTDADLLTSLTAYVADDILEGDADDLDADTPLLELGVLNSLEVVRMLAFIERAHGVRVPADAVQVEHLANLRAIAALVAELRDAQS